MAIAEAFRADSVAKAATSIRGYEVAARSVVDQCIADATKGTGTGVGRRVPPSDWLQKVGSRKTASGAMTVDAYEIGSAAQTRQEAMAAHLDPSIQSHMLATAVLSDKTGQPLRPTVQQLDEALAGRPPGARTGGREGRWGGALHEP